MDLDSQVDQPKVGTRKGSRKMKVVGMVLTTSPMTDL